MSASYTSKHGTISRPPYELYMSFADMRNFTRMLPEDKREMVRADFDSIEFSVQGFKLGARVATRQPYELIRLESDESPFRFSVTIHFDRLAEGNKTDFWIELDADLNLMMKMMLGGKIQEALDKVVDGLSAVSEGRMPEGVDLSQFGFPGPKS